MAVSAMTASAMTRSAMTARISGHSLERVEGGDEAARQRVAAGARKRESVVTDESDITDWSVITD